MKKQIIIALIIGVSILLGYGYVVKQQKKIQVDILDNQLRIEKNVFSQITPGLSAIQDMARGVSPLPQEQNPLSQITPGLFAIQQMASDGIVEGLGMGIHGSQVDNTSGALQK